MAVIQRYLTFRFGSCDGLNSSQMEDLVQSFDSPVKETKAILGGRMQVQDHKLEHIGPVVIKPYFRGGLLRHINKRTYLGIGKARSRAEFEMLKNVRQLGINAPEPVAYAVEGRLLYRAWLVTKQIPNALTLAELCFTEPAHAQKVLPEVARQVRILIRHGIHHVDLHPGNVLVDDKGLCYCIDFDRAGSGGNNSERLKQLYIKRWKRAADKYRLPEFVKTALENG
ncbi:MAG: lipopolysaccharide kinase InaA family protein [Desulfosalsimonas sp.]